MVVIDTWQEIASSWKRTKGEGNTILEQQRIEWRDGREGEERGPQSREGSDEKLRTLLKGDKRRGRGRGREEKKRKRGR